MSRSMAVLRLFALHNLYYLIESQHSRLSLTDAGFICHGIGISLDRYTVDDDRAGADRQ
jgi:hypothetical protein